MTAIVLVSLLWMNGSLHYLMERHEDVAACRAKAELLEKQFPKSTNICVPVDIDGA